MTYSKARRIACPHCGQVFWTRLALNLHAEKVHPPASPADAEASAAPLREGQGETSIASERRAHGT